MKEPATPAGKVQLEKLADQIRMSELGGSSERIIFAAITQKMLKIYREEKENIELSFGEEEDGLVRVLLKRKTAN